jgi:triosephosphate isomerase (TIM)
MIFVNFKTYEESSGERAVALAKMCEEAHKTTRVPVIPVVQDFDLVNIKNAIATPVWIQHIDEYDPGAHTGSTVAEIAQAHGASGTFLNHSEHRFTTFDKLEKAHSHAKAIGLKSLIFAKDIEELRLIARLNPNFLAYEPPELVGSTSTSVTEAQPDVIKEAVEIARREYIPLIVGAGIKSVEDIRVSLSLGATGFAIASNIVKSEDQRVALEELLEGFK